MRKNFCRKYFLHFPKKTIIFAPRYLKRWKTNANGRHSVVSKALPVEIMRLDKMLVRRVKEVKYILFQITCKI